MFRITPIGSCRIATPLRLARDSHGFQVNQSRVYGFCHSSAEAVQLMRYLAGSFQVDPKIAPMLSRRGLGDEETGPHLPSDLYVVELSSAKEVRIGSDCVQLNYLAAHFAEFFADKDRVSGFWEVCETADQDRIDRFLADHWGRNRARRKDCALLRQIRRTTTTEADLRRDIRSLLDGLPAVLFVTHVDALTPDGRTIPTRSRFIRSVEAAVQAEGGVVYNPTRAMQAMGQTLAIEDYSDSLAHFTEDFSRVVVQDWFETAIEAVIDGKARQAPPEEVRRLLAPHVAARLSAGDAAPIARRLERLVRLRPECGVLHDLLAGAYAALGQAQSALATLRAMPGLTDAAARTSLLRRRFDLALDLGDGAEIEGSLQALIALGSPPPPRDLLAAAEALRQAGQPAAALPLLALAMQKDAGLARAAEGIVAIARQAPDLLATLDPDDLNRAAALLPMGSRLELLRLANDLAALAAELARPGLVEAGDLASLSQGLTDAGRIDTAAAFVADWRRANRADRITHPGLRAVIDAWVTGAALLSDRAARIARLSDALLADPLHGQGRLQMRALRKEVLGDLRRFVETGDLAALEGLRPEITRLDDPIREYDLLRMRLLFQRADYPAAMAAAQLTLADDPDSLSAWSTLMRAAQKCGDLLTLDFAAQGVLARADQDCSRLADEARDRLDRNPVLCFRAARDEADPLLAYRLFAIARRNPDLQRAAELRLRRLESRLAAALYGPAETDAAGFETLAREAASLLPDNDRVRLSLGRYHVRRRDFAAALPHWEYLIAKAPDNQGYAVQAQRCRARLGPRDTVVA